MQLKESNNKIKGSGGSENNVIYTGLTHKE